MEENAGKFDERRDGNEDVDMRGIYIKIANEFFSSSGFLNRY